MSTDARRVLEPVVAPPLAPLTGASRQRHALHALHPLCALIALALLLRCVAAVYMPLVPEEAYYWMYSEHPSLSYFDHPPMVAWVIGLGTRLFGDTEAGVRVVGASLMLGSSLLMYRFGRAWFGRRAGFIAACALQVLPLYFAAGLIATMDSALLFWWLLCLNALTLALRRDRRAGWYLAGLAAGGALLSKYIGVFLIAGAVLAVVLHPRWRRHLRSPHPYLGVLLAIALFSPVLLWNWSHDWASFRFQFIDRFGESALSLSQAGRFLLNQIVALTPVALAAFAWLLWRAARSPRRRRTPRWVMTISFSVPLLLLMFYKSLRYEVHINWTLPAFLSVMPALAKLALVQWRRRGRRNVAVATAAPAVKAGPRPLTSFAWSAYACVGVNIALLIYVLTIQPWFGGMSSIGPWRELARTVEVYEDLLEAQTGDEPLVVADGKYRLASVLAFYRTPLEKHLRASDYTTSQWMLKDGAGVAYPFWMNREVWAGRDVLFVDDDEEVLGETARLFDCVDVVNVGRLQRGGRSYAIAIGCGFRPPAPDGASPQPHRVVAAASHSRGAHLERGGCHLHGFSGRAASTPGPPQKVSHYERN